MELLFGYTANVACPIHYNIWILDVYDALEALDHF